MRRYYRDLDNFKARALPDLQRNRSHKPLDFKSPWISAGITPLNILLLVNQEELSKVSYSRLILNTYRLSKRSSTLLITLKTNGTLIRCRSFRRPEIASTTRYLCWNTKNMTNFNNRPDMQTQAERKLPVGEHK